MRATTGSSIKASFGGGSGPELGAGDALPVLMSLVNSVDVGEKREPSVGEVLV